MHRIVLFYKFISFWISLFQWLYCRSVKFDVFLRENIFLKITIHYVFVFSLLNIKHWNLLKTFIFILIKVTKQGTKKYYDTHLVKVKVPCDIYSQFYWILKDKNTVFNFFESQHWVVVFSITVEIAFIYISFTSYTVYN